jgi:hypothetical protein
MNKHLWLDGREVSKADIDASKVSKDIGAGLSLASVYTAPPRKNGPGMPLQVGNTSERIFVMLPQKPYLRSKTGLTIPSKRKSLISAAALSFVCFIGVIFVAIGLLHLMIRSFKLQPYAQAYIVVEQAAHKPGSGPAPQDAVLNEYQHALTREMVAASDTTLYVTAEQKLSGKGMLEQITFSEETPDATDVNANRKVKIYNGTARTLDRVVVQIDVLDKEGHLLRSEYHTTRRLAALGAKTIELKAPAPGAQLRCFVQEVRSKSLRTSLRSL